jgi:collagen type VII alpha
MGCCVLVSLLAACGGASSSLGGGDAGGGSPEGGTADTGASSSGGDSGGTGVDGASGDSGTSAESGSSDTGSPASDAGCVALGAGATDVYVDQRYTGASPTGVQACPFPTITQGLAAAATLSGDRTVHVAGATPALIYAEASSLTVDANITLEGDGPNMTTISAAGACGSATCAVQVNAGGTLGGFTVTSPGGDAIVTSDGSPSPAVKIVTASGAQANGLLALGGVELGPNFSANGNGTGSAGGAGVESPQGASGVIHVIGMANTFNENKGNGIDVNGGAILNFEGGAANRNFQGIRLAGSGGSAISGHTITSLTATGNTGPGGVVAYDGQTIKMRSSTLTGNSGVGLYYAYVNGSMLDIGTAQDAGGNVFGGATASNRNTLAGLRVCGVTAANQLPAAGDSWSACAPTQTFLDCGGNTSANYSDILYGPNLASAGVPVDVTSCSVGP